MSDINWAGLNNRTNPFGEFADGLQRGTDMRRQQERDNIFKERHAFEMEEATRKRAAEEATATRKAAVGGAVAKGDFGAARTAAGGDFDMLESIGKLDAEQRKTAAERAGVLVAYVDSMQGKQPQEIKAQIMQDAPALIELGYTQEQLAAFVPTPTNLARLRAEALGLKGVLEQRDREADNTRADAQAAEVRRANGVRERQGERRIGIAADTNRRGWASHNERKKQGGYGAAMPGGSGINPAEVEWD